MTALILAQAALWGTVLLTVAVVLLLLQRVRALYRKIAPLGALSPVQPTTSMLDTHNLVTLAGNEISIGGTRGSGRKLLLLFVSGTCLVSQKMASITQDFCKRENLDLFFVGDDTPVAQQAALHTLGIEASSMINTTSIGKILGVDRVPFAVLLAADGTVEARGLVNNREHLESLLSVMETGHISIQSYLDAHPHALSPS
ncbi:methylamine dehydrogenase [Acetobacter indonesiensis]|uniref:methylamine dehydrogenase n=1 Tax=Acetobacter indonesiensis TaxID=104101 RepID=UPI000A35FB8D|nr:methylamine dehydrogenase [Acetobacter indonesiensis]OUI95835.1 methylamine dehydrogenase [Acetobacter indonesiensis]